jgi:hypothetical protein
VTRSVDGFDTVQLKAPLEVRECKGSDEATAGSINVDWNVPTLGCLDHVEFIGYR